MDTAQVLHRALQLANAGSIDALVDLYRAAIRHFGFSHFILTGLPTHGQRFETLVLERYWPEDWMSHYVSRDYIKRDPVALASVVHSRPFTWKEAWARASASGSSGDRVMMEAADAGLKDGVCVPIPVRNARSGCISLAGEGPITEVDVLQPVNVLSLTFASRLQLLVDHERRPEGLKLSQREREVLTWVAEGKTAWEISRILGISDSTVNKHIAGAMRKTGAVTRTQAVAKAMTAMEIAG
ncbi:MULTISPECIES: autoinducer binding domain-containing protein [unclassified Mesorhizobium]|uniref:autoinducer binding domain-containing protein n=1 Tax=unclassified Mesorhizobium TaxID=325217 RepID=UPI000FD9AA30|nr:MULTISPECIES: autoinducer binding domain-containing protein [unclassified Mesorhizobium]TGT71827.1 LuxR family transcriptional regulator [Mesorhizobium sp. M2E.F.Ca.ET.166.01.1.1]TGV99459.1 LuxR family transcriptional regulator [Mesorhizobium sp. M2E.F.Ca.ET.154.01.1.1]